jgi:hypothetical protein
VLGQSPSLQLALQPNLESAFVVLPGFADGCLYYFLIVALALAVGTVQCRFLMFLMGVHFHLRTPPADEVAFEVHRVAVSAEDVAAV